MRFIAVVATLGTVSALLLPPTISSEDKETIDTLSFENVVAADGRIMQIDCPGCPVDIKDILGQTKAVTAHVESALRLNFSIAHGEDADELVLNGLSIYRGDGRFLQPQVLTADQLVKSADGTWNYAASPTLGYSFGFSHPITSVDHTQISLIEIHVRIHDVGTKRVDGIAAAGLKLLETPSGKLMIGDAQLLPPLPPLASLPRPTEVYQQCTNFICKWRAIVAAKLSGLRLPKLKGCNGSPKHSQAWSGHGESNHGKSGHGRHGARPHDGRPHGSHQSHRHSHRHGSFSRFVRGIVFHIFIPIFIGIVVGITASLVGMVVGHLAIFLFRLLFRRSRGVEYQKIEQDESKSLVEHQSPPPVYEDAPTYEEVIGNEKSLDE